MPASTIAQRLIASCAMLPSQASPSRYAAAIPMLAAAGIVVTEMSTPISAPDLAVDRLSMPATPAQAATKKVRKSGLEMRLAEVVVLRPRSRPGRAPVARKARVASQTPVMASGKPTAERERRADRELAAGAGPRRRRSRPAGRTPGRPPSRRRSGSASPGRCPTVASSAGEDHEGEEDAGELDVLARVLLDLLPHHRVGRRAPGAARPPGRPDRRSGCRSPRSRSSRRAGCRAP